MKQLTFDEAKKYLPDLNSRIIEICKETNYYPRETQLKELKEEGYGTVCGFIGNRAFENLSKNLETKIIALINAEDKSVGSGYFWVDFKTEDQAWDFRDKIEEGEGSARFGVPHKNGFLFEVE